MTRIIDIALKDLMQLLRDVKTFMFLLLMPIVFTVLFGFAFGGFGGDSDARLPVGYISRDDHWMTDSLHDLFAESEVIRLDESIFYSAADLEARVADGDIAAAIVVPDGYGRAFLKGKDARLTVIADTGNQSWTTIEAELLALTGRLDSAVRTATIIDDIDSARMPFDYVFEKSLSAWDEPPIAITETTSLAVKKTSNADMAMAHTAPGMMLQFSIAGLLTVAQIIVTERKTRALQRMLTTATHRFQIVCGHYLAVFLLIFSQFLLLTTFAQLALRVNYLRVPLATLLVAFSAALCIAGLGLLIGFLANSEDQAVVFSLIPMFVFAGLGGAWVPLEVTGATFSAIGHLTPVAWAMDGFENICARGLGFQSVLLPSAALVIYAGIFFSLAVWRLNVAEAK